jgi:prepilin-type N-terminal cleavage/methylation domain-containing protein
MKRRSTQFGFTLIELLIVVAIIAILAAIAVPNFLEAQVRSKVSRVKADMRSLATGMEAYRLDNNWYPLTTYSAAPANGSYTTEMMKWGQTTLSSMWRMSTPVAYIVSASAFASPFGTEVGDHFPDGQWTLKKNVYWYVAADHAASSEQVFATYTNSALSFYNQMGASKAMMWFLCDAGPDRTLSYTSGSGDSQPYDPTNGTVSRGDIYRFGP